MVGLMLAFDSDKNGQLKYEQVGADRYFEIMAFHAKKNREFWDADVEREIYFSSQCSWSNPDDELSANEGHYKVVDEICKRLLKGDTFKQ